MWYSDCQRKCAKYDPKEMCEKMSDEMNLRGSGKMHYAWWVTLGCGIVILYQLGLAFNCISIFLNPLMESLEVNNTLRSSLTMLFQIGSAVALPFVSPLAERIGLRRLIFLFGLSSAAGYIMLALAGSIWVCYVGMFLIGFSFGAGAAVPTSLLLAVWFQKRKGFAIGMAMCGSGVATVFAPSMIRHIIATYDVHTAFTVQAALIGTLSAAAFLLIRNDPKEKNLLPYGYEPGSKKEAFETEKVTLAEAVRDKKFILTALATLLVGTIISPTITHLSPIISQSGYGEEVAAMAVSVYGIVMLVSKPLFGTIIDRYGVLLANTFAYGFIFLTMISGLLLPVSSLMVYSLPFCFAMGGATITNIGLPIWCGQLFGQKNMGSMFSMLKLCVFVGALIGATIPGYVMDRTGSYNGLFLYYIVVSVLSYGIIQFTFAKKGKGIS